MTTDDGRTAIRLAIGDCAMATAVGVKAKGFTVIPMEPVMSIIDATLALARAEGKVAALTQMGRYTLATGVAGHEESPYPQPGWQFLQLAEAVAAAEAELAACVARLEGVR